MLSQKNIENYCPLNKVQRQWADRKKIVLEPVFKSYVFLRIADTRYFQLRKTDGILNFVNWLNKPAVIRDEEIEMIKHFMNDHDSVRLEKVEVNLHDTVRILSGPLMNQEGQVLERSNKAVRVLLPSLGVILVGKTDIKSI